QVGLFSQKLFYYTLNTKCVELDCLPWSLIVNFDEIGLPADLRKRVVAYHSAMLSKDKLDGSFKIIEDGGWHFSYLGSPEQIVTKIEAFSHDELNVNKFKKIYNIQSAIANRKDVFGRNLSFTSASFEELPKFIVDNVARYKNKGLLDFSFIQKDRKSVFASFQNNNEKSVSEPTILNSSLIIFDQYSRYRACSDLLLQAGFVSGNSVLDIGSGPECLFGQFMLDAAMVYVDPLIPSGSGPGYITGNVFASELDAQLFDFVSAVDVLEHVPSEHRQAFLERLSSLAKNTLIIGFPTSDSTDASDVDKALQDQYHAIFGNKYSWLEEHDRFGLPSLSTTIDQLQKLGWHCQTVGHGHVPWLKELLGFVICTWHIPILKRIILDLSEQFNRRLYPYDFRAPHYRQFIIASRNPLPPVSIHLEEYNYIEAEEIFQALMEDANKRCFSTSLAHLTDLAGDDFKRDTAIIERDTAIIERDTAIIERDVATALVKLIENSSSWRLTRPLRFVARLVRYGFTSQDQQWITKELRNRYHSLPLPVPAKSLIRFVFHRVFWKAIRILRRSLLTIAQFHAPSIKPIPQTKYKPDYLVWGVIDWHFRHQRPQQLALALAATGRRVFYISPTLVEDGRGGFEAEALDVSGHLFQIKLFAKGAPTIYSDAPSLEIVEQLHRSIGEVLDWAVCRQIVSLVDHPFWLDVASVLPNSRLVYDCMDHHEGFGNNSQSLLQLEKRLLNEAELTVTTSTWLENAIASHAKRHALIRNAGEYAHFSKIPESIYRDSQGRRVIGYYGAIAEWFDLDLVEAVARLHPDCSVLLIGADTANAKSRLAKVPNVTFTGEVPYSELPHYLHGFDVCLLPFKVIPLTLATNPVKAYEYLGAGKPIVSVDLPEMAQFGELVYAAAGKDAFLAAVSSVLSQPEPDSLIQQRKAFAQGQTWQHRVEALIQQAESAARDTKVSVIVVTYNNIELTQACLESLDEYSQYEPLEIIVVDNASSDGTPAFLSEWVANGQNRRLILNNDNLGFAAANNQGLAVANGDYLVLLNNDTYVTPGWIRTLVR
ncbi:MAG: glycosyltransferase, partial [Chlorobium sp.]|nr:glycosyltransferase [Chlorobium sp.]